MTRWQVSVGERLAFYQMRQAVLEVISSIALRVVTPNPASNLEEAHTGFVRVLCYCCNIDVVKFFSIQETRLLKNTDSFKSFQIISNIPLLLMRTQGCRAETCLPQFVVDFGRVANTLFASDMQTLCQGDSIFQSLHCPIAGCWEKGVSCIPQAHEVALFGSPLGCAVAPP